MFWCAHTSFHIICNAKSSRGDMILPAFSARVFSRTGGWPNGAVLFRTAHSTHSFHSLVVSLQSSMHKRIQRQQLNAHVDAVLFFAYFHVCLLSCCYRVFRSMNHISFWVINLILLHSFSIASMEPILLLTTWSHYHRPRSDIQAYYSFALLFWTYPCQFEAECVSVSRLALTSSSLLLLDMFAHFHILCRNTLWPCVMACEGRFC